jgi:type IV pilus assembly protein PilQ
VPFFGDIPFFGFFFRNNSRSDNKTELLVFITPRIVEQRIVQR